MIQIHDKSYQIKIQEDVRLHFKDYLEEMIEDYDDFFPTQHLGDAFKQQLKPLLVEVGQQGYSSLAFYWINLLDGLAYLMNLYQEFESSKNDREEIEEDIINFWTQSDLAGNFLDEMRDEENVLSASGKMLEFHKDQILAFFALHLSSEDHNFEKPLIYTAVPELGDCEKWISIKSDMVALLPKQASLDFPFINISKVSHSTETVEIFNKNKFDVEEIFSNNTTLKFDDSALKIFCQKEDDELKNTVLKKTQWALEILKDIDLYEVFTRFTQNIICVDEPGVVSYSMQELPGYSSINVFERDELDYIDDLLHENGHHFLNTLLNVNELILEDEEKIFYSPWREAPRPIRGIYHATCTFYWALELYYRLSQKIEDDNFIKKHRISKDQSDKILFRFLEEYYMLAYCGHDISLAFEMGKITPEGYSVVDTFYNQISAKESFISKAKEILSKQNSSLSEKIQVLIEKLEEKRKEFQL